jgi:glycosyltransferase involved in cell wall biosynthesis
MDTPLVDALDWTMIDSTLDPVPPPTFRRRCWLALKRLWLLFRTLRSSKVDGVFIFSAHGLSFLEKGFMAHIARMAGKRVILSPRSGIIKDDCKRSPFMRNYVRSVLRRCDVILCQSESWRQFYQHLTGLPDARFQVIENWLKLESSGSLRARSNHGNSALRVVFLGWVVRNKGIMDLVEVVRRYRERLPGVRFIICGDGRDMADVNAEVAKHGLASSFEFLGWVGGSAKKRILVEADIFVLLSYHEGLPNALLEAMAAGCAVVATKVGAVPDVVRHGVTGLLVAPGDVEAIGQALIELRTDPVLRVAMGASAEKYIRSHHDVEQAWPRILKLLLPDKGT